MIKAINRIRQRLTFEREQRNAAAIIAAWEQQGKPVPAPGVRKQQIIRAYQAKYNVHTLVETGTFLGDMIAAQLPDFSRLITIELSERLYRDACNRFKKHSKVEVYQGDSGKVLPEILPTIKEKALFWLDGHYSAGITALGDKYSPILEELEAIFKYDLGHILLIDDARGFNGEQGYPTLPELEQIVKSKNPAYSIVVEDDIIRVTM